MSANDRSGPDRFFDGPAISFATQPNLRKLFTHLVDPDKTFTFVVGAGVSLDAKLPTWTQLIDNIAELIPNERWRAAAKDDHSELLRKAESSLQLAQEDSANTPGGIIRDALYRRSDGSPNTDPTRGRLADAIARLTTWLDGRVYIATTNFDTLLEDAMNEYRIGREKVTPVPFIAPGTGNVHYRSYRRTGVPVNWQPGSTVLHLHGILQPRKDPEGDIVLTETDFLRYGPGVRNLIRLRLLHSHVVFIGVSLTDPNLVSPLWQVKSESQGSTTMSEPFLLSVAAPDPKAGDVNRSRAYSIKKAQYLDDELGLHTIFFKSYGQQIQAIAEASLAIDQQREYLSNNDPATSPRYGHRLKRNLDACYVNIGCGAAQDIPDNENARLLSDRLNALMESQEPGSIKCILNGVHNRLRHHNNTDLRDDYESGIRYFTGERFGLFLWLRSRKEQDHPHAQYHLTCVGTSVYQHRLPWSFDRTARVEGTSRHTSGKAAFLGSPQTDNVVTVGDWQLWHSVRAVPFSYYDQNPATDAVHHAGQAEALAAIDIGVITLNSTHNYLPHGENRWSNDNPRSLFSVMNDDEKSAVNEKLAKIALEVVSAPLATQLQ